MAQSIRPDHPPTGSLPITNNVDIVACRQTVRAIASGHDFTASSTTMLVTAASELARNTLIHGGGGTFGWEVVHDGERSGVRLSFEDSGPGITDIGLAMTNGWTSGSGMGLGLPGAKRLSDDFELHSEPGVGTRVVITRWARSRRR